MPFAKLGLSKLTVFACVLEPNWSLSKLMVVCLLIYTMLSNKKSKFG